MFEDFLEEFEEHAFICKLTDLQRVDTIIRYMDPFTREFCKTLSGFRIRDWNQFQTSLLNAFHSIVPQHRVMQQKLHHLIEDTSRI